MGFSIELEAISLLIIVILALFHYDRNNFHSRRYHLFNVCLILTACAIVSNIVTCVMMEDISAYSLTLHMIANSIYFVAIHSCFSMVAAYVFTLLFAYMREQKCYKIAIGFITIANIILTILVVVNIWTGCYFYFENNTYCRGPLNRLGFIVLGIEACMLCMCYIRNRKYVTPYAKQLIQTLPVLVIAMLFIQVMFPDVMLVGTIAAMANLIIFACFQNNRIGRDALTELPNRPTFFKALSRYKMKGLTSHIVLVHVCQLDKVNKRYGMSGGDTLLYNVARYLENLSSNYRVYRFGNTHFVMLGDFHSMTEAEAITSEIYDRFSKPWVVSGEKRTQQVQLIHLKCESEENDENTLIEKLDYMLTYSKDKNESMRMYFSDEVKNLYERKLYVLNEVKKALRNESFELYYQPVFFSKEKQFKTAEVLLRLFTEDGSAISPGEFIPIAEENGLGDDISWLVFKKAVEFMAEHPELPLDSISINMSIQQMRKSYIDEKIDELSKIYMDMVSKIRIEITEGVITKNPSLATKVMNDLVNGGLNFYLDDFGMGYSNFARVLELPFEVVKLDRSMMQKIDMDDKFYQVIKSMVEMLHNAGFIVLAEGLERESQIKKAEEMGIDRVQGFYYARPMSAQDLVEFLKRGI